MTSEKPKSMQAVLTDLMVAVAKFADGAELDNADKLEHVLAAETLARGFLRNYEELHENVGRVLVLAFHRPEGPERVELVTQAFRLADSVAQYERTTRQQIRTAYRGCRTLFGTETPLVDARTARIDEMYWPMMQAAPAKEPTK